MEERVVRCHRGHFQSFATQHIKARPVKDTSGGRRAEGPDPSRTRLTPHQEVRWSFRIPPFRRAEFACGFFSSLLSLCSVTLSLLPVCSLFAVIRHRCRSSPNHTFRARPFHTRVCVPRQHLPRPPHPPVTSDNHGRAPECIATSW